MGAVERLRQYYEAFLDWKYRRKRYVVMNAEEDFVMIDRRRNELANCSHPPGRVILPRHDY